MLIKPFAVTITLIFMLAAAPSRATVTVTDCATDAHCVALGRKTLIEVPDDTLVIGGAIVPLPERPTFWCAPSRLR
jgi:hypothetical protein